LEAFRRVQELRHTSSGGSEVRRDLLGFHCSLEDLIDDKLHRHSQGSLTNQRDLEWVEYLKAIGGPENLKPAGVFKASRDLKAIVRRGIPVAFRSLVWQKISLSSIHRLDYPSDYYSSLLLRVGELSYKVRDDIEKDVDRLTNYRLII
jgi:hypothetical protein